MIYSMDYRICPLSNVHASWHTCSLMCALRQKKLDLLFSNEQVRLTYPRGKTQVYPFDKILDHPVGQADSLFDSWRNLQSLPLYARVPDRQNTDLPDGENAGPPFKQCKP